MIASNSLHRGREAGSDVDVIRIAIKGKNSMPIPWSSAAVFIHSIAMVSTFTDVCRNRLTYLLSGRIIPRYLDSLVGKERSTFGIHPIFRNSISKKKCSSTGRSGFVSICTTDEYR